MVQVSEQYIQELKAKVEAYREENYYLLQRCEAAEKYMDSFPINLKVASDQNNPLFKAWQKIKNSHKRIAIDKTTLK